MNAPSKIDMLAAARLTREGRLAEAMDVLRKSLSIGPSSDAPVEFEAGSQPPTAGRREPAFDRQGARRPCPAHRQLSPRTGF